MTVIFRVDSSVLIGSGHVMRCLTLAEELRNAGAEVSFVTRRHDGNLNDLISGNGFRVLELPAKTGLVQNDSARGEYARWLGASQQDDAGETIALLGAHRPEWLIVDHYAIDEVWEQLLRPYVDRIMIIDDLADRKHDCDMLLDQNYVIGLEDRYQDLVPPPCTMLLGPKYALLRKEFSAARQNLRTRDGSVQRIFIFFGGVDSDNMTGKALDALSDPAFASIDVDVVIGASNPHRDQIGRQIRQRSRTKLHVQVDNIAGLMVQADLALCAGGSSTWERLCVGLPSLVVTIADNQVPFTRDLYHDGFLQWLGVSQQVGVYELRLALMEAMTRVERNRKTSEKGKALVDGHGCERVSGFLLKGPDEDSLLTRKASDADCKLFWFWVNDQEVRKNAFHSDAIPREQHQTWFSAKLHEQGTTMYVVESDAGPVGQVRFEKKGEHYSVDYSLVRQCRGLGLGRKLLSVALQAFQEEKGFGTVLAEVKAENSQSNKVFARLGFEEITHTHTGRPKFSLAILSDRTSWLNPWIGNLLAGWAEHGHCIQWVHEPNDVPKGEMCFMLSCSKLVKPEILKRNKHNLVVHESDLPQGKGWSPMTWQVLEGARDIPVTLFEAAETVDSGPIYLQDRMVLEGHELVDELRAIQADATLNLCRTFVNRYPEIVEKAVPQSGAETFYRRRQLEDSRLDPHLTIAEQFNLLRVVDNERYPAFFDWQGERYIVKIEKQDN